MFDKKFGCSFRHLERLTDDTGMLEHSTGIIPNRQEGYSADDNARALWASLSWMEWLNGKPENESSIRLLQRLSEIYTSFLLWAQDGDGWLHNNYGYDRIPEPETASEDCQGRTLWAAALASTQTVHSGLRLPCIQLLIRGLHHAEKMTQPRGWAWSLAACSHLLMQQLSDFDFPNLKSFRSQLKDYVGILENRMLDRFRKHAEPGWRWFEPMMTYGNGVLPWSLFKAYEATENRKTLEIAADALDFLAERMTAPQGWIRPVGNLGWATKDSQAEWDQQPLDVMKLGLAAEAAFLSTGRKQYRDLLAACREWFLGRNDKGVPLANPEDGSCQDGLMPEGPNGNCGAESTLSYLLMEVIYARTYWKESPGSGKRELMATYRVTK